MMKGYAISSEVPQAPITEEMAEGLTKSLYRLQAWWKDYLAAQSYWESTIDVKWSPKVGDVLPDPEYAVVHVVQSLPDTPGDIAYHYLDNIQRPICLISWAAILNEFQGRAVDLLHGPDGVTSAISHEMHESLVDPTCQVTVPLPDSPNFTPLEVDDWVQGADYEEVGLPGIYVSNAVGPAFFKMGVGTRYDIRSDLTTPAVTRPFEETPGGYHEVIAPDGSTYNFYGERVSEKRRIRLERTGARGGMRKMQRIA